MMVLAAALIGGAWGIDIDSWLASGLRPSETAQGAVVFAFLSWNGVFAAISALMGLYALARWMAGHVEAARPSTFDLIALFIGFSAGQGAFAALLTRLFPGGVI